MFCTNAVTERTYKCKRCGKSVEIPYYCSEWGWWYGVHFCCSYKCMSEMRKKDMTTMSNWEKPPRPRAPLTADEIESAENMILRGYSNEKVAMKIGRSKSAICNIRKRMVKEGKWATK